MTMGHQERAEHIRQARLLSRSGRGLTDVQRLERWATFVEAWMVDVDTALADLGEAISGLSTRVAASQEALQAEIDTLSQQGSTDTTALQAVADQLEQHVADLNAIDPVAAPSAGTDEAAQPADATAPDAGTDAGTTSNPDLPTTPGPGSPEDGPATSGASENNALAYYTYSGDSEPGDTNGSDVTGWALAVVKTSDGRSLYTTTLAPADIDASAWPQYTGDLVSP